MASPVLELNNGVKMPQVGFGLWKVTKSTCADTVYNAIKAGYRLFDGAADYGNEKECGEGVARAIKDGLVKREELFITTKVWNTNHAKAHVHQSLSKQLSLWGIEYFDLYLIHFPIALAYVDPAERYPPEWSVDGKGKIEVEDSPIRETWEAMEEIYESGKAKAIGISNFAGSLILDLFRYAKIKPAVLQIEHHPLLTQENLIALASALNIKVTAYSSFGPQSFEELNMARGIKPLFEEEVVRKAAERAGRTPAQVLLRWATQRGLAVIPKSNSPHRLAENLSTTNFDLTEDELEAISGLNRNVRFNNPAEIDIRLSIFA